MTLPGVFEPLFIPPPLGVSLMPAPQEYQKAWWCTGVWPHLFWAPIAFLAHSCTLLALAKTTIQLIDRHHQLGLVFAVISPEFKLCLVHRCGLRQIRRMTPAFLSWNPGS